MNPHFDARSGPRGLSPTPVAEAAPARDTHDRRTGGRDRTDIAWIGRVAQVLRRWHARWVSGLRLHGARRVWLDTHVRLARGVVLDARGGTIVVGSDAWIGPGVIVLSGDSPPDAPGASRSRAIQIAPGACIEADAIILGGVSIGMCAVVGAGAVVRHDVPDHSVVSGSPATVIGTRVPGSDTLEFFATRIAPATPGEIAKPRLA